MVENKSKIMDDLKANLRVQTNFKKRLMNTSFNAIFKSFVSDFYRFKETDPKEVMVTMPQELYRAPRNDNVLRSSLRRSFRLVLVEKTF